jgi:hypothetical protein
MSELAQRKFPFSCVCAGACMAWPWAVHAPLALLEMVDDADSLLP